MYQNRRHMIKISIQQKYVRISATEVAPKAPLQNHTAKQRKAKEPLAACRS